MANIYEENGYLDREDYLKSLAEINELDLEDVVRPLAEMLGEDEDFDGLIVALEDAAMEVNRE